MHKQDGIERYYDAHERYYETALAEIKAGQKESHWMWFIFPQIDGLGHSPTAKYYAIKDFAEAKEYWSDPLLSSHLIEISEALFESGNDIKTILGYVDSLKLKSCATLFWTVSHHDVFKRIIDHFYHGGLDGLTLAALNQRSIGQP